MKEVLREAIRVFWSAVDSVALSGKRDSCTLKGSCVWLNNAFGVFLMPYINTLHYAKETDSDVLTSVESIAGHFGTLATEHTWLRLQFGGRVIQLDLSAAQFGIESTLGPAQQECYLFTRDQRYLTEDAETVSIEQRWQELKQIDAMWRQLKGKGLEKLEYLHLIVGNIEGVLREATNRSAVK